MTSRTTGKGKSKVQNCSHNLPRLQQVLKILYQCMHTRAHTHTQYGASHWSWNESSTSRELLKFHLTWLSSRTSHHFCCCRFWNASTVCTTQELVSWISYHLPKFCPPLSLQHTFFANVSYTEGTQQTFTSLLHLWMSVAFGTVTPRNVQPGYLSVSIAARLHTG